ncbi:MAG: mechanosensitive ion channel family protein [Reichenbachiella sp.]|uniref:mechanosensitive ion channel family protein n=1 Tax=Reichenbachiella sp. TaxID=2184521 RepID=UPI0029666B1F|nr:mechanosensitive ion channel family protein [Reichenbachiella sp.]MDW3208619.1 mechanosensitive ion channel family protein [Reichenbachiella sp.]
MRNIFICLFIIYSQSILANPNDTITSRLETPYLALNTFVSNISSENSNWEAASILFNNPQMTVGQKVKYAKKLEQVLDGAGIFIFFDKVPTYPDYFDSVHNEHVYVINSRYPEIFLQKKRGRWQFQPEVMESIDQVHEELFKFDPKNLIGLEMEKTSLSTYFLGLKLWQWIGIAILFALCFLIRYIFSIIFERIFIRLLDKIGQRHIGSRYILPVARPAGMLMVFFFIGALYPSLELPRLVGYYVVLALKGLIPLYGMIALYQLTSVIDVYLTRLVNRTESTLDDQLIPIIRKVLRVGVVVIGGLVILDSLDVPILPLLTGLSIGGLAFALAAQDTIKNFFGSFMIFVDKPFQIGDWIVSGDIDGMVEEVGFRSTRIRTFRNSVVSVPNGQLADRTIDNNGLRRMRRFKTTIQIKYDTPPSLIEAFVKGLNRIVKEHPKTNDEKYEIHFNDLGAHSLDILFYIFFEAASWTDELKFRQEILLDVLKLAEHLGVEFAYPTQTLHVENMPGHEFFDPKYIKDQKMLDGKLDEFFKA